MSRPRSHVPPRALAISFAALLVPLWGSFHAPGPAEDHELILWLLALVPAFFLAYYRGWKGVALALVVGMAVIVVTQVAVLLLGRPVQNWPLFLTVVAAYIGISLGIGWVSEMLHRDRAEAERLAHQDELTGLPNRRSVREHLQREFAAARRGRPLCVVMFDLDRFKEFNDRYGHIAGDDWLRTVAGIFRSGSRESDLSARYGGEEFLSVLVDTEAAGARIFAERIVGAVRSASSAEDAQSLSAGVAQFDPSMANPDDLLAASDAALYAAKAAGRNCVRVHASRVTPLPAPPAAPEARRRRTEPSP